MINRQDIFDRALTHLRTQGVPAVNGVFGNCRYRDYQGNACAIGGLIPDERYNEDLEDLNASDPMIVAALGLTDLTPDDTEFLNFVQRRLHDNPARSSRFATTPFLELVEEGAVAVAARWELNYAPATAS